MARRFALFFFNCCWCSPIFVMCECHLKTIVMVRFMNTALSVVTFCCRRKESYSTFSLCPMSKDWKAVHMCYLICVFLYQNYFFFCCYDVTPIPKARGNECCWHKITFLIVTVSAKADFHWPGIQFGNMCIWWRKNIYRRKRSSHILTENSASIKQSNGTCKFVFCSLFWMFRSRFISTRRLKINAQSVHISQTFTEVFW